MNDLLKPPSLEELKNDSALNESAKKVVQRIIDSSYNDSTGEVKTKNFKGRFIRTSKDFITMVKAVVKQEVIAFDTEFTSLMMQSPHPSFTFVGCSFSWGKNDNYYVSVGSIYTSYNISKTLFKLGMYKIFSRKNFTLVGHNLKAEIHALAQLGITVETDDIYDTLVAMWDLDENEKVDLKSITRREYGYDQTDFSLLLSTISSDILEKYTLRLKRDKNISHVHPVVSAFYAMDDTFFTFQLWKDTKDLLVAEEIDAFFYDRQMPYLKVLVNMERRGIKVDREKLKEMSRIAQKELEDLEYRILEFAGIEFSVTSSQQLAEILFGWRKTKKVYATYEEPILDSEGNPQFYKSGPRKGQQKMKEFKTDRVVGEEFCGNIELVENSFELESTSNTKGGAPSTGADALESLAKLQYPKGSRKADGVELVKLVLRHKKLTKLKGTYMDGLQEHIYPDGKIHCSLNQTGTTSGRLSSSNPNLQQLPRPLDDLGNPPDKSKFDLKTAQGKKEYEKAISYYEEEKAEYDFWKRFEIRGAFISNKEKGKVLVASDWSNLEMRILAHFSQDELLLRMFETGVDSHGDTAKNMFKLDCEVSEVKKLYPHLRQQAKSLNFLLVYGGTAIALSSSVGVTKEDGQELYDLYFDTYTGVRDYMQKQKKYVKRYGFVQTILGRKRHLSRYVHGNNWGEKGYGERLAVNAPIQGSGADIAVSSQILIENDEELKALGYVQLLQVHDEIVGECPLENVERVMERKREIMANCLPKPLNGVILESDADFGFTYSDAK